MIKIFKYIAALFIYIFLVLEGFVGGATTYKKNIWADLMKWVNKQS